MGDRVDHCRGRRKPLGLIELLAIAIGGMIGGGIFTILGISVQMVGVWAPLAIALGAVIAALAAWSYVKLALLFMDEGATYAFVKRAFPARAFAAALIGWWVVFGYISTIALYAYTFASYALGGAGDVAGDWRRKAVALLVIGLFAAINLWSVRGMGRIEDLMVYVKVVILAVIAGALLSFAPDADLAALVAQSPPFSVLPILVVASVTFVAFEGFQLVINAINETDRPERNIPRAIHGAILLVGLIYVVIALAAVLAIPFADIVENREYALAAGARQVLGGWGDALVVAGALLATMSAISGTLFGASHQMAAIAEDGYLPRALARRRGTIQAVAVLAMAGLAGALVVAGSLRVILEFGSVTFLLVSFLMALTNHHLRARTGAPVWLTVPAMAALLAGTGFILWFEATTAPEQLAFILGLYALLTAGAWLWSVRGRETRPRRG